MNLILLLFIAIALSLMGMLFWAVQPPKIRFASIDEVFETLSGQRHYQRLPQILQSLQSKDTEFLRERGHLELVHRLNAERKGIALRFLTLLQEEYRTFWEASRMLAATAPDVVAVEEWERLPLSTIFTWNCFLLQLKLRAGFAPRVNFTRLSDMASQIPIAWSRRPRKSARAFDRLLNFPRP